MDKFLTQNIITKFKGERYAHTVHYRPVWPILEDIVSDPRLTGSFALYPEQRFVRRSENDATPMRTWEELHHGNDWWYLQVSD